MSTIRAYTTIEQSRKLAKILPIESADMCYIKHASSDNPNYEFNEDFPPMILGNVSINEITAETLPCWSLAALLAFLPNSAFLERGSVTELYRVTLPVELEASDWYIDPIDACYEMILKLHELKML